MMRKSTSVLKLTDTQQETINQAIETGEFHNQQGVIDYALSMLTLYLEDQTPKRARSESALNRRIVIIGFVILSAASLLAFWLTPALHQPTVVRNDVVSFIINLLSTGVIAMCAGYIFRKNAGDFILEKVWMVHHAIKDRLPATNSGRCRLSFNSKVFVEVKLVEDLIRTDGETRFIENFNYEANKARDESSSSIYVLPLTAQTYTYFFGTEIGRTWLNGEKTFLQDKVTHALETANTAPTRLNILGKNRPKASDEYDLKRVLIIGDHFHPTSEESEVLQEYVTDRWRIIRQRDLGDEGGRLFRNFCLFTSRVEKGRKPVLTNKAFFTYLDKEHNHLFIKGAWAQYMTTSKSYTDHLIADFDNLWQLSGQRGQRIEDLTRNANDSQIPY